MRASGLSKAKLTVSGLPFFRSGNSGIGRATSRSNSLAFSRSWAPWRSMRSTLMVICTLVRLFFGSSMYCAPIRLSAQSSLAFSFRRICSRVANWYS
ncbi:hypothetical protein D3C72_2105850 [compost metagenome]